MPSSIENSPKTDHTLASDTSDPSVGMSVSRPSLMTDCRTTQPKSGQATHVFERTIQSSERSGSEYLEPRTAISIPQAARFPPSRFSSTPRTAIFRPNMQGMPQVNVPIFGTHRSSTPSEISGPGLPGFRQNEAPIVPKEENRSPLPPQQINRQIEAEEKPSVHHTSESAMPSWQPQRHVRFDPFTTRRIPPQLPAFVVGPKKEEPDDSFSYKFSPRSSPSPSPTPLYSHKSQMHSGTRSSRESSVLPPPRRSLPPPSLPAGPKNRVKRANLEEDEPIWSTLPTRKKPKPAPSKASDRVRNGGVVTTARFSLPVIRSSRLSTGPEAEEIGSNAGADGGRSRKVTLYRPPPRKSSGSSLSNQDADNANTACNNSRENSSGGTAKSGSNANEEVDALGWKVVRLYS